MYRLNIQHLFSKEISCVKTVSIDNKLIPFHILSSLQGTTMVCLFAEQYAHKLNKLRSRIENIYYYYVNKKVTSHTELLSVCVYVARTVDTRGFHFK